MRHLAIRSLAAGGILGLVIGLAIVALEAMAGEAAAQRALNAMAARAPMGRKALASALFRQYGSVERGRFRAYTLWLQDADEVTAYARRYPNG